MSTTPEVLWAQRSSDNDESKNIIYLTITAPDVPASKLKVDLTATKLSFTAENKNRKYHVELEFFAEIDPKASKTHHSGRGVDFVLRKKDLKAEFWPRLLKEPKKVQFLKTDFDKWVDEEEQEESEDTPALGADMSGMGGGGGMGDMGEDGGLDFAKMMQGMGGGGGAGGMDMAEMMKGMSGMGGMGGMGGGDEGDSDDDMPELEDSSNTAGDKKIQEVK